MHNFFSGLMGFFMGFSSFFHGGHGLPPQNYQSNSAQHATISGTPVRPSGNMGGKFGREKGRMNIPAGEKPFFGTVTAVNGSALTLQMRTGIMRPHGNNAPSIAPQAPQTITIDLDSSTTYTGGSASDIKENTRIAGIGKTNSDKSLTAVKVQINPAIPSGFPHRPRGGR